MFELEGYHTAVCSKQSSGQHHDREDAEKIDKELRKEQAGVRQGRGALDQIFILRNIMEQSVEWQAPTIFKLHLF